MKTLNIVVGLLITLGVSAQKMSIDQILDKVEKNEKTSSSIGTMKQTITTSKGSVRTLTMESYSKDNGDKQLTIYVAPSRVKGDKILMVNGDDIWFYTPKTDRVRHLASNAKKQKVQGSDYSYQDMEQRDYKKDFTSKLVGNEKVEGIECYKVEAIPTETGPNYSKIIYWIDKDKFISVKCEFYEDDELLKTLNVSDIRMIENHWVGMKMNMVNNQSNSSTLIETIDIKLNVAIDDSKLPPTHN